MPVAAGPSTGLYVHVPFCARACPYCDFDFSVTRSPDVDAYLAGLEQEIERRALAGLAVRTLYIGGGTPSLLGADGLARLLALLRTHFVLDGVVEVTVELNPEHAQDPLLDALREFGCDRVSLGTQTFDVAGLVQLGRAHRPETSMAAIEAAVARGLAVSADLIVGWPGQTAAALEQDLAAILAAGARHLSVYALTIESNTPWEALVRRGKRQRPDDDAQADRLLQAAAWAEAQGWGHYEVASYSAQRSNRSQHNLSYWTALDYVGLGPSAASARFGPGGQVQRRTNPRGLSAWLADQAATVETLDPVTAAGEGLWLGLRVLTGMSVVAFLQRFEAVDLAWVRARVERAVRRGDIVWDQEQTLRIAPDRWLMHDAITAALL